MEYLVNRQILNCIGESVSAAKAFKNKKLILFYFSASWCEPCKKLLPVLKKFFQECAKKGYFQLLYISSDDDPEIMLKHFKEKHSSGWYALPVGDPCIVEFRIIYEVTHMPTLIVVRVADGFIVSKTGWEDIVELGPNALIKWRTDDIYF